MIGSEDDKRQARENRLNFGQPKRRLTVMERVDPDYPGRAARRFIPPGYVGHEAVLIAAAEHLLPAETEIEYSEAEELQLVVQCIHFLRGLLFEAKLAAYHPWTGPPHPGLVCLDPGYWLGEETNRALLLGEVRDGITMVPLLFESGAIEKVLQAEKAATEQETGQNEASASQNVKGGRPRKISAALAAYDAVYPNGHRLVGDGWKDVALKISEHLGEPISIDTIQRALSSG